MDKNKLKISTKTLQQLSLQTNEAEWFSLLRKKSMHESYALNYPTLYSMDLGEWSLLDFDSKKLTNLTTPEFSEERFENNINFSEESIIIVQENNKLQYVSIPDAYKEKIKVTDIFTAISTESKIREVFASVTSPSKNKLTAIHYVLMNAGIYIEVQDNAIIDIPVQYLVSTSDEDYSLVNHVALHVGKNSSINFVENYVVENNSKSFNIVTEVLAEENAQINYSSVTNFNKGQRGTILRNGFTHRNAFLNWNIAAMDSADVYHDNTTNILGDGSESNLKLVTLGSDTQKSYFNSELINQGLNTNGDILQHGVLLDESHVVFNGVGFITKGASGSNAYQSSRLLTLSDKAKADANPMLLIDENDVAAGHGASLGKIDQEQIYYLNSRGLSTQEANRLLVHGFLVPVIEQLKVEKVRELVIKLVDEKINK